MHAKMTRDRKKNFIATIEKTIDELERDCQKMRDVLNKVGAHQQMIVAAAPVTPLTSPRVHNHYKPEESMIALAPAVVAVHNNHPASSLLSAAAAMAPPKQQQQKQQLQPQQHTGIQPEQENACTPKRAKVAHGFSWNG